MTVTSDKKNDESSHQYKFGNGDISKDKWDKAFSNTHVDLLLSKSLMKDVHELAEKMKMSDDELIVQAIREYVYGCVLSIGNI